MSRPLRIAYPGAWYHIMNRGRRSEAIYSGKEDFQMFIALLEETADMWNIRISAYCLMPNHYHLLLQTPDGNISRAMRHINGVYTQRYNRKHGVDGPLFRGRYKSILIGADNHLLKLVRYIHRNPVKAGLVDILDNYPWTSHKGYLSVAKKWRWLYKEFIFSLLTKKKSQWIKQYRHFVSIEENNDITTVIERKKWPAVLGAKSFVDWIKGGYYDLKTDDEVPQAKTLAPTPMMIIDAVCAFYDVRPDDLKKTQRGIFNEPRNAAVYLMRKIRRDRLKEIGEMFGIGKYSSVSSMIEGAKHRLKTDRRFRKRINDLSRLIINSQKQT